MRCSGFVALVLFAPVWCRAAQPVTFSKDIAPILYGHCASCHHTGDIAPMALITYRDARPWAKAIRDAVVQRTMPPWHADLHFGKFANDPTLSAAQIETIRAWVEQGAPEGDPRLLPPAPEFPAGWKIGKPDLIIDIGEDHRVDAEGPDEYVNFTVPTNFTEDKWVKAVELRPGNPKVVHHAHVYITAEPSPGTKPERKKDPASSFMFKDGKLTHMKPDAPVKNDGCAAGDAGNYWGRRQGQNGILGSYLPGKAPDIYPLGTAKLVPAGSKLTFQIHYSRTTGKPEVDRTRVGFIFASTPPERPLKRMDISNYLFLIPAGEPNQEVTECHTFDKDIELLSMTAHMHVRGKDMRFDLVRPSGERETLLFVPQYRFAWQTLYRLQNPVKIEKGSRLIITAHFDNSANNKWNPDPLKNIRWGEPSNEEMMDGWLEYLDAVPSARTSTR